MVIVDIFYNGGKGNQEPDEYVEIRYDDVVEIQIEGIVCSPPAQHRLRSRQQPYPRQKKLAPSQQEVKKEHKKGR